MIVRTRRLCWEVIRYARRGRETIALLQGTDPHLSHLPRLFLQFRMHNSTGCTVYLETGSTPIIEGCKDLVFGQYPSVFIRDSKVR